MNDVISRKIAVLLLNYEDGKLDKCLDACVNIRSMIQEEKFRKLYMDNREG